MTGTLASRVSLSNRGGDLQCPGLRFANGALAARHDSRAELDILVDILLCIVSRNLEKDLSAQRSEWFLTDGVKPYACGGPITSAAGNC